MTNYPDLQDVLDAIRLDDGTGFCLSCGQDTFEVEPAAKNQYCNFCGDEAVFGASATLLLMGNVQ